MKRQLFGSGLWFLCGLGVLVLSHGLAATEGSELGGRWVTGRVLDPGGNPISGAEVRVLGGSGQARTDASGSFQLEVAPGLEKPRLLVWAEGFLPTEVGVPPVSGQPLELTLEPITLAGEISVLAERLVASFARAQKVAGSYEALTAQDLERFQALSINEALRKLPGLFAREEEGWGLRPNLGVRGLNPTRSNKLLLLEDGVPLAYAPYGDNASYYHPPLERFESVELLKGSAQIAYGPQTVGGVLNYLTPDPPAAFQGSLLVAAGNRGFQHGRVRLGNTWNGLAWLLDLGQKEGDGARENTRLRSKDGLLKLLLPLRSGQHLTAKVTTVQERSQQTYSGLTQAEWDQNPRQNPFRNDELTFENWSGSLRHDLVLGKSGVLSSTVYGSRFSRDWWRQSSNSLQRPNDAQDPACGGMANLLTTCGNEGRLRDYTTWGFDNRLWWARELFGASAELQAGLRYHAEEQERRQKNGPLPTSRDGVLVENNRRETQALSGFLQARLAWGSFVLNPGFRVETIEYERTNRLANGGLGVTGSTSIRVFLPGLGAAWNANPRTTLFAGVHRGFAPPRAEDIITNSGGIVELEEELAWNYELGVRSQPVPGLELAATAFRIDYTNQVVPQSLAGGIGSTLTNGGETLHQGLEALVQVETKALLGIQPDLTVRVAATWLPVAEFRGVRYSSIPGFQNVSVSGNRLPYAPEKLLTASLSYRSSRGVSLGLEGVYTGSSFADDLNTRVGSADGQRGWIPALWLWNSAVELEVPALKSRVWLSVKNLENRTAIVDRSRGLLPTMPRLVHLGWKFTW